MRRRCGWTVIPAGDPPASDGDLLASAEVQYPDPYDPEDEIYRMLQIRKLHDGAGDVRKSQVSALPAGFVFTVHHQPTRQGQLYIGAYVSPLLIANA